MRLDKITSDYNRTLVIIDLVNHVRLPSIHVKKNIQRKALIYYTVKNILYLC